MVSVSDVLNTCELEKCEKTEDISLMASRYLGVFKKNYGLNRLDDDFYLTIATNLELYNGSLSQSFRCTYLKLTRYSMIDISRTRLRTS